MKYIVNVALLWTWVVVGFLTNNVIKQSVSVEQEQIVMQQEMQDAEAIAETEHFETEKIETGTEKIDLMTERIWGLYSNDYTLVSDSSMPIQFQNDHKEWLVHHITKTGELWRVVVFQTKDEPLTFLQKLQWYEGEYVSYITIKNTTQWLSRKLFDGMAESQYFVTQRGDIYLYFFDTFAARGCGDEEICLDTNSVIDTIGWK